MEQVGPADFDGTHFRRPGTWAVDFSAEWCPFCRRFQPRFASLEGRGPYGLALGDLTDLDSPLWDRFEVEVVPTVVAFRDGEAFFRRDGRLGEGLGAPDLAALEAALGAPAEPAGSSGGRS